MGGVCVVIFKDIFGFYASVHYFLGIKIGFNQKV